MTCSFPTLRGPCGRRATVLYTRGREQHPRCRSHDTIAARWYASTHVGWTRVECPESATQPQGGSTGVVAA